MAAMHTEHPELGQLSAFALGQLESAALDSIESHLAKCDTCCDALKQMKEDTFVGLVRQARPDRTAAVDARDSATMPPADLAVSEAAKSLAEQPQPLLLVDAPTEAALSGSGHASVDLPPELANHPRYRVVELLGAGGMGAVYKAEHRLMQRTVAVKVINPKFIQSKQAVERFHREFRSAGRLQHPNIVHAYDAEQAGDVHFLAMEFVKGTDLQKVLEERGPLPAAEAAEYIRQAALGLQHAHENGMVHRDIKPQNLMVSRDAESSERSAERVKILDFGLASLTTEADNRDDPSATPDMQTSELTQAGALMGTPDYMAPEQAKDARTADIRSDIYSLGCTLYALLCGKVPFPGGTAIDKVIAHAAQPVKPMRELRPKVPIALVKVLDKMMAKDPAARYQMPADVADALASFTRVGKGNGGRSRRRKTGALLTVAAGLVLLLGGIIYVATDNGQLVIDTKVDDVKVVITKGGQEFDVIDLKTGSKIKRLPSGKYDIELRGNIAGVTFDMQEGFTMTRWGQVIVTVSRNDSAIAPFTALQAKDHQNAWAKRLGVPVEFTDAIGMRFRLIPAGEFNMGTSAEELAKLLLTTGLEWERAVYYSEAPQRRVIVSKPYYLAVHEVTVGQFREFVKATGYQTVAEKTGQGGMYWDAAAGGARGGPEFIWSHPSVTQSERHPVSFVTLKDASEFCAWRSQLEGLTFVVPSEEEWEFACRAGTTTRWWTGDNPAELATHEIIDGNAPRPVGSGKANPFGLFDMHGNVFEIARSPEAAMVQRGGACNTGAQIARSASRNAHSQDGAWNRRGFRVAIVGDLQQAGKSWISLFNGKDLTGWKAPEKSVWTVEDGMLVGRGIGTMLVSAREFAESFHLRCEVKVSDKSFSHLKVRLDAAAGTGYGLPIRGPYWINGVNKVITPAQTPLPPVDTWFVYEVIANGPEIIVKINDKVLAHLHDTTVRRGHLALHTMSPGTIQFKKIEIKEIAAAEAENPWRLLLAREADPKADVNQLRADIATFRRDFAASPQALQAAHILRRLPSPLDQLDHVQVAVELRNPNLKELVAAVQAHPGAVTSLTFRPDGMLVSCSGKERSMKLWDLSGKSPAEVKAWQGHSDTIWSNACSPDGKLLATSSEDKTARLWNLSAQGAQERAVVDGYGYAVTGLAFAADGRTLATASWDPQRQGYIRLLDVGGPTWTERALVIGHTGLVQGIAFTPDGRTLASGALDGTVRLWDLTGPKPRERALLRHPDWVYPVRFSPDGSLLVSGCKDGRLRVWDATKEIPELRVELEGRGAFFSPDGRLLLASGSGKVALWDGALPQSGAFAGLSKGKKLAEWDLSDIGAIAFSPDSRHLAFGSSKGVVTILRLAQAERPRQTADAIPKSDKERILGTWKPLSAEVFGEPTPQALIDLMQPTITFTPDKLTAKVNLEKMPIPMDLVKKLLGGIDEKAFSPKELTTVLDKQGVEAVYTIDPTKTPKTINISYLSPVRKTLLGIYSIDGDTLRICVAVDPQRAEERPTEFAGKPGQVYGILKRQP